MKRFILIFLLTFTFLYAQKYSNEAMIGELRDRTLFNNPYANVPPQCYMETSYGTQNPCLFCHTNAPARMGLGNTIPQAGLNSFVGNLQLEYAFGSVNEFAKSANINPWENIIKPEILEEKFRKLGIDTKKWDNKKYIKEDNWSEAFKKRGETKEFKLFPNLNPDLLPANKDGFVRASKKNDGLFKDSLGYNTGWRAVNFIPYGIFTPYSGSVSGIYIKLGEKFMKDEKGNFSLSVYKENLRLLEKAIQDRLDKNDKYYKGAAKNIEAERGLFPLETQFAHPLHYVDVEADETYSKNNKFPGLRANRVKEIRYMVKYQMYYPQEVLNKEEDGPIYYNKDEAWIDNGAGWYLSGFIEDEKGDLRGQTPEELLQCMGCHSSTYGFEPEQFTSGSGNTIDTVWSFPRKLANEDGWKEMNYLAYKFKDNAKANEASGYANIKDPINRASKIGEFRYFLNHVVGASLYGDMPEDMDKYLQKVITEKNGYSNNFPSLKFESAKEVKQIQELRLKLIREFTKRKNYLKEDGTIQPALYYPSKNQALKTIEGYRKIVSTQRYTFGKDYFGKVPFSYRYFREADDGFTHIDGTPYKLGEVVIDRPFDTSETITKGVGNVPTLIEENGDNYDSEYLPLFKYPMEFEKK